MSPKTIIAIVAVLLLAAAFFAWYFLPDIVKPEKASFIDRLPIIGGRTSAPCTAADVPSGDYSEGQPEARLRRILDADILASAINADGKYILYIDRSSGHLKQADLEGKNEATLANLTILESFEGLWSPLKNRAMISYPENGAVKRFVESTATGTPSYFLPAAAISGSWSPDGKSIAYLVRQGADTSLVIADQANRGARTAYTTPVPDFTVVWASKNIILLVSKPSGIAPSLVLQFDTVSRRITPLLPGSKGVVILPAPDGGGFIFSGSSGAGSPQPLAFYSFSERKTTALEAVTIAEKCAFSADAKMLFCGVPRNSIPVPSPDEWYRGSQSFYDDIVEINIRTGQMRKLAGDEASVDAVALFTSPEGKYLFFQDKTAGGLWRLAL